MNSKLILPLIIAGASLGACEQTPVVKKASCKQELYQDVIGRNIGEVTFAPTVNKRIVNEGDPVTMDHSAQRLNVQVDAKGWIQKIYCG